MPKSSLPRAKAPRRRGTRAATRERLVAAALDLLHAGGVAAVSTVSVTRAAGIVQSGFYQHFANVEACLAVTTERVAGRIREAVAGARRAMYESGPGAGADLERFYRGVFELTLRQRATTELFLRYRSDSLALGGVMYRLAADLRSDLARDLEAQAAKVGLKVLPAHWIEGLADNLIGATLSAVEAQFTGRGPPLDEAARLLAAFSTGACLGVIEVLRAGQ